jgi:DNA primase
LEKILNITRYKTFDTTQERVIALQLPTEYKPLWIKKTTPDYRNAIHYLQSRGITMFDIIKYRIGYCESGEYAGKIIIPSYNNTGQLNYFVSRAFYKADSQKHKNPKVSKDIIGFEMFINWSEPIILCEGAFDAIAVKRNAIPLFGKIIQPTLQKKIIEERVRDIYLCLDADALRNAIQIAERFMAEGLNVYFVELQDKDPSELGFYAINEILQNTDVLTFERLMQLKMGMLWT